MPCVLGGRYVVVPALISFFAPFPAVGLKLLLLSPLLCKAEPEIDSTESLKESAPAAIVASTPINEKDKTWHSNDKYRKKIYTCNESIRLRINLANLRILLNMK